MTQEDKELLSREFSARLPNGLKGTVEIEVSTGEYSIESGHLLFIEKEIDVELLGINKDTEEIEVYPLNDNIDISEYDYTIYDFIPYLRPMSSMTKEERKKYNEYLFYGSSIGLMSNTGTAYELIDWLNAYHFDYRGLIEMCLAIEAPNGMYN